MRGLLRVTVILGVAILLTGAAALPAGARAVGPKQFFTGVINGKDGNTTTPIVIRMACVGPLRPGETGHPVGGQTLAVHQLFPPTSAAGSLGYTGTDSEIGVFFNAPPPGAELARAATRTPVFTRYDRPKPLPASLTLPCTGKGTVWFTPIAAVPPSRSANVPVRFVSRP